MACIRLPDIKNNNDLKSAWMIIWYKVNNWDEYKAKNIYDNWLIVLYAMMVLISLNVIALNVDQRRVNNGIKRIIIDIKKNSLITNIIIGWNIIPK